MREVITNLVPISANKALHLTANSVAVLQSFVPHQSLVVFTKFVLHTVGGR